MNRVAMVMLLAVVLVSGSLMAAETSVHGRLYTHWEYDMTGGANGANYFGLERAYVTVKSKLSDITSVRITTDLKNTEYESDLSVDTTDFSINSTNAKNRFDILLKYAYFDIKPNIGVGPLTLRIGLQPTPYIDYQNTLWGRRYLSKTVGDANKFLTTSDLGASVYYALGQDGEYGSLALGLFNGTSYSSLGEENKQKDVNLFAQVNPLAGSDDLKQSTFVAQYYKGTLNKAFDDSTLAGDYANDIFSVGALLSYRELVNLGADLNWHTEGQGAGTQDMKEMGSSFHGTLFLGELVEGSAALKTLNLFGRYDNFDPDTKTDNDAEKLLIVGVECNPTQGFKASVNFRSASFDDGSTTEKRLFVNTLFKF